MNYNKFRLIGSAFIQYHFTRTFVDFKDYIT